MSRLMFAIILAVGAAGCAHEYAYLPAVPGAGNDAAVRYPVPPEAPQGEVYVTSFGFTEMEVAQDRSDRLLHARVVAVNSGAETWTVDGNAQQVMVPPAQQVMSPAFINTDAGNGPVYTIPPAQRRVFDFYYAIPPPQNDPAQVGFFELSWRVDVAGRPIAQRTPFQRYEDRRGAYEPYPPYVFVGLGFGVGWWYGPAFYPYHYRPIIRTYYYPPIRGRTYGPAWRGVPPGGGGWRGTPGGGGGWRGTPGGGGGGWRGTPGGGGGGWRGSPGGGGGGWRGSPGGGGRRGR
jgi:hypothetical protein